MNGFKTPYAIKDILNLVDSGELVLPAIQRDYVWKSEQVCRLFDSLMQGYPISSFLFWRINSKDVGDYKFYKFLKQYREDFSTHGNECDSVDTNSSYIAVLDGQQRLTSIVIGFRGTYAWRGYHKRKDDNSENARPSRRLYLNISHQLEGQNEEDSRVYDFEFKTKSETEEWKDIFKDSKGTIWFRVGKILDFDTASLFEYFQTEPLIFECKTGRKTLAKLLDVTTGQLINYYLVEDNDLHKALNIFIRINSGGTYLSFSDIILSIAISYWRGDAKRAFDDLRSYVAQRYEFYIGPDFILKTFLVLHSSDVRFKATNFKKEAAFSLEENWDNLSESIKATFDLIREFGYSSSQLKSYNALIPITYYIYYKKIWAEIRSAVGFKLDRNRIKHWLHIVNISGAFGRSTDAVLVKSRKALSQAIETGEGFPAQNILKEMEVSFSEEHIDNLLTIQKDDWQAFPVLAILFPQLEYRYHDFHKDHMHAADAVATYAKAHNLTEDERQYYENPLWWNSILNLQMLDANENMSKQDASLTAWLEKEVNDNKKSLESLKQRCYIPQDISTDISELKGFLLARRELLREALKKCLCIE